MKFKILIALFTTISLTAMAQTDTNIKPDASIEDLMGEDQMPTRVYANNAFKSTRVINNQSMEMLGKGVLDVRILHRFGYINDGVKELFGLDQASMRMGLDYGINKNLSVGIGRSTYLKEIDGFVKYRIAHQHTGVKAIPVSVIYVAAANIITKNQDYPTGKDFFSNKLSYVHQVIIGRKFNNNFSLQVSPTFVHRNVVETNKDFNNVVAVGIGTRYKLTQRMALVLDASPIVYGANSSYNTTALSIGIDLETGGHVFQMHFSNAKGMNERAFISETTQDWTKGQFQFGFNLSRVFTVRKNTSGSW
jgi:Membrane bound beta barrel domain (DUF5777)